MKQNDSVFYNIGNGVGVEIDGTVGMELWVRKMDVAKDRRCLRIYPLKYQQKPGEMDEDNAIQKDGAFIELCFGSPESVEQVIDALELVKEHFDDADKENGKADLPQV